MSIYRKMAFEPAPATEEASGRSGLVQTFLSIPIGNLTIVSLHEISIA